MKNHLGLTHGGKISLFGDGQLSLIKITVEALWALLSIKR